MRFPESWSSTFSGNHAVLHSTAQHSCALTTPSLLSTATLEAVLSDAYMLTIVGYGAPATDAAAVELLSETWVRNPSFELAQVNIVDIRAKDELEKTWEPFFCRSHYAFHERLSTTWMFRHPRRSGEALAMATLQNDPWPDNPFPELKTLAQLHRWIAPLLAEEDLGRFSGNPCSK